jgi:hypothetical protein
VLDLLTQVANDEPEPVRSVNPGADRKLEAICHRCLRREPAQRYPGGLEVASALRGYLEGLPRRRWFAWRG